MKSLIVTPEQFRTENQPCKLRYFLLSQAGAWFILGFTHKAVCQIIPKNTTNPNHSSPTLQINALRSQTENPSQEVPWTRSQLGEISHQAKDLEPIGASQSPPEFELEPLPQKTAVLPDQAEAIGTARIALDPKVINAAALPSKRCWQLSATCTYTPSSTTVLAIQPTEGRTDPEIGDLRLTPIPETETAELGELNIQPLGADPPIGAGDPELGTLRLQERTTPQPPIALPTRPRQPSAFLLGRLDYFKTANVFSDVNPVDDGLIRSGLTFFYAPPIGPRTYLISSVDANLIRYGRLGQYRDANGRFQSLNYDELRFRVGVFHRLTARLSGEIGWSNQKLFTSDRGLQQIFSGQEFFGDNSLRVELSRQDQLSPRLSLNTFYQFRWSLADPNERSRILNSFIATLGYRLSPQLQTALDYQFSWSHFTQIERDDFYHQLVGRVTYNITPQTQLNVFSGFSFGSSSDSRIDFNSFIFGAGLVFRLPLF